MRIAIDTGGTFTDCVYVADGELRVLKLFSTPRDPSEAVRMAIEAIAGVGGQTDVRHGTTVGTNALLERRGARVAFVTTEGFEDTLGIGRQARSSLYDWFARKPPELISADACFGVKERMSADGNSLLCPDAEELDDLRERLKASGAEAVAISLLFSFANSAHERAVLSALERLKIPLSASHRILPEFREYERASTVAVNAYLAPKLSTYLERLSSAVSGQFEVMQSSGGIVPVSFAAEQPVRTVLSGPAGGVMGVQYVARLAGYSKVIAFDMGGTSTDVSLIDVDNGPRTTREASVGGVPVSIPMLDIHTVGAGGGSIARFDEGGLLRVGPESAGADPGPICYGRGTQATVTDANLVLRRIDAGQFLGGEFRPDAQRAREFLERLRGPLGSAEEFAEGILRVAETVMAQAIRVISIERGNDPREYTLVAFGGAGPLHACALARELEMKRVLIPAFPGALSALGILLSEGVREYSKTVMCPAGTDLEGFFHELEYDAPAGMRTRSADLRYAGQGYELNVATGPEMLARFHAAHRQRFGYADETRRVEVVTVRLRVSQPGEQISWKKLPARGGDGSQALTGERDVHFGRRPRPTRIYDRALLAPGDVFEGPAVVFEYTATTVVPPEWRLRVDEFANLILEPRT